MLLVRRERFTSRWPSALADEKHPRAAEANEFIACRKFLTERRPPHTRGGRSRSGSSCDTTLRSEAGCGRDLSAVPRDASSRNAYTGVSEDQGGWTGRGVDGARTQDRLGGSAGDQESMRSVPDERSVSGG